MMTTLKRILCSIVAALFLTTPFSTYVRADDKNLSVGKEYTVTYDSPIENAYPACAYEPENKLTDGQFAKSASYSDTAFLHLYRGTMVSVTIDLGKACAISSVELRTLQIKSAGIYCARYVNIAVSEDGESFGTVGTLEDLKSITSGAKEIVSQKVLLDKTYFARYVRVSFSSDVNTYVDEITVFGSEDASGATTVSADSEPEDIGFSPKLDGIGNIVLMYTVGNYTEERLCPYFAYIDAEGTAKDIMFDSMLFLPSPASGYDFTKKATWDSYTDNMFGIAQNINLAALNNLVGDLREELNLDTSYRYPVFLAVPYLELGTSSFDGIVPNTLENRLKIIESYIDSLIETFETSDFQNLELKGLYWFQESVLYTSSEHEEEFIIRFNEYAHSKDLKTIWIPYYCASGFERAVALGFDSATLQSGYAFPRSGDSLNSIGQVLPEAVEDSAMQAKKYGLGMEFEIDLNASDAHERFYKYLHTGYQTGCMTDGMMMLYQGVDAFYRCANASVGTNEREIYDLTYLYNQGEFTSHAPVIEPGQVVVAEIGTRASGTIKITDGDSFKNNLDVVDLSAPDNLSFLIEGDGFYILNTSESSAGLYQVSFRVSDGYNLSEECTVKFLLIDKASPAGSMTLESELLLYSRLDTSTEAETLPAGTVITLYDAGDGWKYISAEVDGREVEGFAELQYDFSDNKSQAAGEMSVSADADDGNGILYIICIAAGAVIVCGIVIFIVKKQKNKG